MLAATCAFLTRPAALISVSDWAVSIGLAQAPTAPQTLKALLLSTRGKGAEPLVPHTPYPSAGRTRLSIPFG